VVMVVLGLISSPKKLLTVCIAMYELYGSQVQLTLERGFPAKLDNCPILHFPLIWFTVQGAALIGSRKMVLF
jgi:hypothetical protein